MPVEAKTSANDVRLFFKTADVDLAELVLEIAAETIKSRKAFSKKMSENMTKARAARGGKGKAVNQATETAQTETPASAQTESSSPITQARARRAAAGAVPSVPAPAHTAEATSAEADATI